MTKYRIPVRVVTPPVPPQRARVLDEGPKNKAIAEEPADERAETGEAVVKAVSSSAGPVLVDQVSRALNSAAQEAVREAAQDKGETKERGHSYRSSEDEEWKERALRLQADMVGYRQRQKRIAHEQAQIEQIALLKDVLTVADNLDRALAAAQGKPGQRDESDPLAQGVELTRSALSRTLAKHGLEQFQAKGKPFDPAWHEAVHVVPANVLGVKPGTVVEVLEDGYRRRGVLFRPAKVVVAQ
jgi:molecular chaperone GrpE